MKNKIIQGDCIEKMRELEENSVDTIITDPPYGLEFMGKKWDYDVPSIELWKECLRVLKHGGTALIFAGSRTQHRMAVNVEDAGFILKDTIMWPYGSGFPKATDISKQLDKGVERKVVGKHSNPAGTKNYKVSIIRKDLDITEPSTPEAKLWNGWKSHGLKPAYEPILVCMKPNEGSYAENALKYGVSGLNIDGGRIGHNEPEKHTIRTAKRKGTALELNTGKSEKWEEGTMASANPQGRFPSNIILDEEAGKILDEQSGESKGWDKGKQPRTTKHNWTKTQRQSFHIGDKGGASRFFYCAKASKSERNDGCEELEKVHGSKITGRKVGSAGALNSAYAGTTETPKQNHHPTVKPLALMEYLVTLTSTPTGGIVLDPFAGSGTTGVACKKLERDFILIEKEKEYIPIIKARLSALTQGKLL